MYEQAQRTGTCVAGTGDARRRLFDVKISLFSPVFSCCTSTGRGIRRRLATLPRNEFLRCNARTYHAFRRTGVLYVILLKRKRFWICASRPDVARMAWRQTRPRSTVKTENFRGIKLHFSTLEMFALAVVILYTLDDRRGKGYRSRDKSH